MSTAAADTGAAAADAAIGRARSTGFAGAGAVVRWLPIDVAFGFDSGTSSEVFETTAVAGRCGTGTSVVSRADVCAVASAITDAEDSVAGWRAAISAAAPTMHTTAATANRPPIDDAAVARDAWLSACFVQRARVDGLAWFSRSEIFRNESF